MCKDSTVFETRDSLSSDHKNNKGGVCNMDFNLSQANTKDKLLILKAIAKLAEDTYNYYKTDILEEVIATDEKYNSNFGTLNKSVNTSEQTVAEKIAKNELNVAKLQAENAKLKELAQDSIYQELTYKLMSNISVEGITVANNILQDVIIDILQSKKLAKTINDIAGKKK